MGCPRSPAIDALLGEVGQMNPSLLIQIWSCTLAHIRLFNYDRVYIRDRPSSTTQMDHIVKNQTYRPVGFIENISKTTKMY